MIIRTNVTTLLTAAAAMLIASTATPRAQSQDTQNPTPVEVRGDPGSSRRSAVRRRSKRASAFARAPTVPSSNRSRRSCR